LKILVILAHPNNQSFNHAIANCAVNQLQKNGHSVTFHDLYAEKFDPILPYEEIPTEVILPSNIEIHCEEHTIQYRQNMFTAEIRILPDIFNVVPTGAAGFIIAKNHVVKDLAFGALDVIAPVLSLEDTQILSLCVSFLKFLCCH